VHTCSGVHASTLSLSGTPPESLTPQPCGMLANQFSSPPFSTGNRSDNSRGGDRL